MDWGTLARWGDVYRRGVWMGWIVAATAAGAALGLGLR